MAKRKRWTVAERGPRPVDVHVGNRLRIRRTVLGFSQEKLAEAVGLTFQQVQKYEKGSNRISASRLWEFSRVLDVPVSYFFDELPTGSRGGRGAGGGGLGRGADKTLTKRETLELTRAYYRIGDKRVRNALFELTKAAAKSSDLD